MKESLIGKPYPIKRHVPKMSGWMAGLICGLCALGMLVVIRVIAG